VDFSGYPYHARLHANAAKSETTTTMARLHLPAL
jgi:hypothetical protein